MTLLAVVVILIGVLYDKVPSSFVPEKIKVIILFRFPCLMRQV